MKRRYTVKVTWQEKGTRYLRTNILDMAAPNAGRAADLALREQKKRMRRGAQRVGNELPQIREVEGGTIRFDITIGPKITHTTVKGESA